MTTIPPRPLRPRWRLSLRAQLTGLCLGFSVVASGLLALAINLLISLELMSLYYRPPVVLDLGSPTATQDMLAAQHDFNDQAQAIADEIRRQSAAGFVIVALVAAVTCWWTAGRTLRPIQQITALAGTLSHDSLGGRIALRGGPRDEVRALADSLDGMLDRLDRAFDGQRLFVANASHELRTPLTVIRTAVDVALAKPERPEADYRRTLATIEHAVQRTEHLLDSLLRLARTQHQQTGLEPLDLADLAATATARAAPGGPEPHRDLHRDLAPAPVTGDTNLLQLLLRNLIDNAARYNIPGGSITVTTGVDPTTGRAILTVENTGPPITDAQITDLLRAFHRGDTARTAPGEGFGLGLAIVDAIVHAHHGHLHLTPRPDGGLHVTVTLPTRATTSGDRR
jgi:signal transduction histidine kinase